jgi:DNA gyrase subunit B
MTDADVDGSHIRTLLLTFFFRHMFELIKRGNVYIAQPPLYGIKKGRSTQYIKDDREFVRVMVKRASEGIVVRYGEGAAKLEGAPLTKFITTLKEYLDFYDKVSKRTRDERVTDLLPKLDLSKRSDFEGEKSAPPKKLAQLEKELKKIMKEREIKSVEAKYDEEHNLWEVRFVNSQGADHGLNWELASAPEYRQMMSKFKQIQEFMQPPFVIEFKTKGEAAKEAKEDNLSDTERDELDKAEKKAPKSAQKRRTDSEPVEKQSARELFEYVLNEGKKDFTVQRYKGLGEMTAEQLWETTMDPAVRRLLRVQIDDAIESDRVFTMLMGDEVEPRRDFIETNALRAGNIDV